MREMKIEKHGIKPNKISMDKLHSVPPTPYTEIWLLEITLKNCLELLCRRTVDNDKKMQWKYAKEEEEEKKKYSNFNRQTSDP